MNIHGRTAVESAMNLGGYENWRPDFDVPGLDRPPRRPESLEGEGRLAGVLILLYLNAGRLQSVLTRRRPDLVHHPGQISLPGGRHEPGETLQQTAVRETEEETGVAAALVSVVGALTPVYIPPSDFTAYPFVGWVDSVPEFHPNEEEVGELIEVDVEMLIDPATRKTGNIELDAVPGRSRKRVVPYFELGTHHVWGATAIILAEFIDRIRRVAT